MFERFDQSARRALFFARYEAGLRGMRELRPEHILFGAMRESDFVRDLLEGFGVDSESLRKRWPAPEDARQRRVAGSRRSDPSIRSRR